MLKSPVRVLDEVTVNDDVGALFSINCLPEVEVATMFSYANVIVEPELTQIS